MDLREGFGVYETAFELFERVYKSYFASGLSAQFDDFVRFCPGKIFNVKGDAGVGKTELIMQIMVSCILPAEFGGVDMGGNDSEVFYFDCNGRFSMIRFSEILLMRVQRFTDDEDIVAGTMESSLQRFYLCRPLTEFHLGVMLQEIVKQNLYPYVKLFIIEDLPRLSYHKEQCSGPTEREMVSLIYDLMSNHEASLIITNQTDTHRFQDKETITLFNKRISFSTNQTHLQYEINPAGFHIK
eukprot:TRINITY_DN13359_c0_g1_i2.p1 TRINITY_DN13359_c0_g1~~TRINITY_DN13359_c0_g1_i2.p1  ORF type:complete len:241 (-),score=44.34 TRINITY_DN13359_c0_g1_i2:128-850(-)